MSNHPQSVGVTLTGGIQDVSALLPLIGTEQCERHVGSALEGGYLYAAAAPLSAFGCLGIVKAAVSILVSSISIPKISLPFRNRKPSQHSKWLGARMLNAAGFQLRGTVAPLIGMDGTRLKAESQIIQILEEKFISNPEKVSIHWKSREWNLFLVLFTLIAAALSGTPYIALLLGPPSWRPTTHFPWIFPFLRTFGSCLATVFSQFLMQSRVISLMKSRVLFMTIHHHLIDNLTQDNKADLDLWLKHFFKWDVKFPAEQCLWSLGQALSSGASITNPRDDRELGAHVSITMKDPSATLPPPPPTFNEGFEFTYSTFQNLQNKQFPSPVRDRAFVLISCILLCLSLPATVAGYVGCFTLVSASSGSGPLVWLGLETALSIVRILIWASNPSFDEKTDITVELELSQDMTLTEPLESCKTLNYYVDYYSNKDRPPFSLIPESRFLEKITPYTGPLEHFQPSENFALYFTLTADNRIAKSKYEHMLMTFSDSTKQVAGTLLQIGGVFLYFDVAVKYSTIPGKVEAAIKFVASSTATVDSWPTKDPDFFDDLSKYYKFIKGALDQSGRSAPIANLTWNLRPKPPQSANQRTIQNLPPLSDREQSYLNRGYEHQLKTKLVRLWGAQIAEGMNRLHPELRKEWLQMSNCATSEEAMWELTELDSLLGWEWMRRELVIFVSSIILEAILGEKLERCIEKISEEWENMRLMDLIRHTFENGRQKRLVKEREEAMERMELGMKEASERAKREGRPWSDQDRFEPQWSEGLKFIGKQWSTGIANEHTTVTLKTLDHELDDLVRKSTASGSTGLEKARSEISERLRQRFSYSHSLCDNERRQIRTTIHRIREVDGLREDLDLAYNHPTPNEEASRWFTPLSDSSMVENGAMFLTDHNVGQYLDRRYEQRLKTDLVDKWERWIVQDLKHISDSRGECYGALVDGTSMIAHWELTELDCQLVWEWAKRELTNLVSSIALEDIYRGRMDDHSENVSSKERTEFEIGRRKRLLRKREQAKKRMRTRMREASVRAEKEGRSWTDQGDFRPKWKRGIEFIDIQWTAGIKYGWPALENAGSELEALVLKNTPSSTSGHEKARLGVLTQVAQRFTARWHPQRVNEQSEIDATIQRIRHSKGRREHLDDAYKYPEPDSEATQKFALLRYSTSKGKSCSAIVYDAGQCDKEAVFNVVKHCTTRSMVNVDPEIVASIPDNNHLLFLGCYRGEGQELLFIQRNRNSWWDSRTENSSTFYFTPKSVGRDYCESSSGTIAHVLIHLETSSRVRLGLLHRVYGEISVSIRQQDDELCRIPKEHLPDQPQLQDFELSELAPGRYDLEVEVVGKHDKGPRGDYFLNDIFVDFFN